ncbi:leucine-rich repeat-containing protein 24 isoform X5 [Herpailurus yagouaroundi]|uniref:leucine-rich repeat-containing protein 24 isoform X5 n=1 Tax=Herpailurus yagouaroundi TaxID=1608482 RepID=UPI001AD6B69D|nr:leucine-rich repeat-containing protein 24 isoform X5 [Puma yagouaroundi]
MLAFSCGWWLPGSVLPMFPINIHQKLDTGCGSPSMFFAGSQVLGAGLPTCVSGGTSHPGWTIRRPVRRLQLRGPRPVPREMAPGAPTLLLLWLLWFPGFPPRAAGCPAACRCYSATVECGALRLRVVPSGIPPGTQRLQELHLQENSIELLEDQALAGLSSLALLDLSRNQLGTISREALQPLASLQVLRLTENPWRCDCALHWLGAWIKEGGQRLLSSRDKNIMCAEPPRLALQSLLDISGSSLICIPPSVHVEPLEVTANLGEDLRVACQASGYPQPLVTWRKVAQPREGQPRAQIQPEGGAPRPGGPGASDTGSGMLFLTNITLAHAGKYECEASNAGGAARVPFQLLVNLSQQQQLQLAPPPPPAAGPVSHEPLQEAGSMAFRALGLATQTAIAGAIALLTLTALLLATMICRRRRKRKKAPGLPGEGALFVNDYSDGPCTFAQLEELRDERGHEMFVIDRSKPLFAEGPTEAADGAATGPAQGLPLQPPAAYEIHC